MKKIWIITLFPEYFNPLVQYGIIGQALRGERGDSIEINFIQLRDYTEKDYKGVDDSPYGGGAGMVMRADVLKRALFEGVIKKGNYSTNFKEELLTVYPSPRGKKWENKICKEFSKIEKDIVFICGRYEGIDERFIEKYIDVQISLGDFVLSGGEIPTMAIIDSFLRFKDGVLGNRESHELESFQENLLEHPQYTRPPVFEGMEIPEILLSGHHKKIEEYRKSESLRLTKLHRPDLLKE
jgi:tRNA (guanine37-N1)-methyltransferase